MDNGQVVEPVESTLSLVIITMWTYVSKKNLDGMYAVLAYGEKKLGIEAVRGQNKKWRVYNIAIGDNQYRLHKEDIPGYEGQKIELKEIMFRELGVKYAGTRQAFLTHLFEKGEIIIHGTTN